MKNKMVLWKLINNFFISKFYFIISLLVFPIIIAMVYFFICDNPITFSQSLCSLFSIDIMIIGVVIVPITKKMLSKSIILKIDNDSKKRLYQNIYIYYFLISCICIIYSLILILLFGLKSNNYEIINMSTNIKVQTYNDYIFSYNSFYSYDIGFIDYGQKNWLYMLIFILFSIFYYFCIGFLIEKIFIKTNWFYFSITVISFISLINGSLLVGPEVINQYLIYKIISYFTISQPQMTIANIFFYEKFSCPNDLIFYSFQDFDFQIQIANWQTFILSICLIIVVIIITISILFSSYINNIFKNKDIYYKDHFYDWNNSNYNLNFINQKNILSSLELNKNDFNLIIANQKNKNNIIKRLKNDFDMLDYIEKKFKNQKYGIYLNQKFINIFKINNDLIFNYISTKYGEQISNLAKSTFLEFLSFFEIEKSKFYNDYLIYLSLILNIDIDYIVIEYFDIFKNHKLISKIKEIKDSKTIIFISNNFIEQNNIFDKLINYS